MAPVRVSLCSLSPLEMSGEMLSSVSRNLTQGRSSVNAAELMSLDDVRILSVVLADAAHVTTPLFVFEEGRWEAQALPP